jgi:hypothetical protein
MGARLSTAGKNLRGLRVVLAVLPCFVFASCPMIHIVAVNAAVWPLDGARLALDAAVVAVAVAFTLWMFRFIVRDFVTCALWVSCFMLLFASYRGLLGPIAGSALDYEDWRLSAIYTTAAVVISTIVVRPWQTHRRDAVPWTILAAVFLVVNGYSLVASQYGAKRPGANQVFEPLRSSGPSQPPARDIYYVVLDGFGQPDTLRNYYGLDLRSFVSFLRMKGFYVTEKAHSNYAQTFLSLASTLNLEYLDETAAAVGRDSEDRRPLSRLIRFNRLMQSARKAGYEVVAIGSDYYETQRIDIADICICQQHGLDPIERAVISTTPLGALPLAAWTYGAHQRKVLDSFAALTNSGGTGKRRFVFAHIVAPHPPFVFWGDGTPRQPAHTIFGFADGNHFAGTTREYIDGYREQARFVANRLTRFVEDLLNRPGPTPVIVLHGDHGPGSMLNWENAKATNTSERLGIFSAYLFPDGSESLYPGMSPVNGARALATRYLGVHLTFLPERAFFSTWDRPYDFIAVAPSQSTAPGR